MKIPLVIDRQTILKYDVPGPRYTSYPTAPQWSADVDADVYAEKLKELGESSKPLCLYFHIPFCQSLCYYCACNVIIRRREDRYGDEYIDHLKKEMELVSAHLRNKKKVVQLHWGGGTPTFLTSVQLERLWREIQQYFILDADAEVSIEVDPRTIDLEKMKILKGLGFNRVSLGVQDFEAQVQQAVNRIQSYEMVADLTACCRTLGFDSLNFDLIYGLPGQTKALFKETVEKVLSLKPDRIALYSFAHVPWLKKHQSKLKIDYLPQSEEKLDIFLQAREQFLAQGYQAIAMDHFALETDELARAFESGTLYRNFMGYTLKPAEDFIGLGITAIGFVENTYVQNQKTIGEYYQALNQHRLPVERGKVLSSDDRIRQWVINALMCCFEIDRQKFFQKFAEDFDLYFEKEQGHVERCIEEGLLLPKGRLLCVSDVGRIFIRNICMGFDGYLRQSPTLQRFSKTV